MGHAGSCDHLTIAAAQIFDGTAMRGPGSVRISDGRIESISFAAAEWQGSIDDATIARTIAGGKPPTMPAFADLLTAQQIQELVKQVRKFGGAGD